MKKLVTDLISRDETYKIIGACFAVYIGMGTHRPFEKDLRIDSRSCSHLACLSVFRGHPGFTVFSGGAFRLGMKARNANP